MKVYQLKENDTIGIICPSSKIDKPSARLDAGIKILSSWGYKLKFGPTCDAEDGYLAGSDELRASDIEAMFLDSSVKAILCLKGGYGASRIIDKIDFNIMKNNPKLFIGFSDITVLLNNFYKFAALPTIHGQVLTFIGSPDQDEFSLNDFKTLLFSKQKGRVLYHPAKTLVPGIIEGKIVGGNLSLIANLVGSDYEIDCEDKILFIEEVNEAPYKVDKMLAQLRLSKTLDKAKGFIIGHFTNCENKDPNKRDVAYLIEEYFTPLNKPTITNFASGHEFPFINIPIGLNVKMNASLQTIEILEELYEED